MPYLNKLLEEKRNLKKKYVQLLEDAYNFKQTDHALSDFSEFEATLILNEINKLKFIIENNQSQLS